MSCNFQENIVEHCGYVGVEYGKLHVFYSTLVVGSSTTQKGIRNSGNSCHYKCAYHYLGPFSLHQCIKLCLAGLLILGIHCLFPRILMEDAERTKITG